MNRTLELESPNPDWATKFEAEALKLREILSGHWYAIYHIGSTAIPNINAKPVIDILVIVNNLIQIDVLNPLFEALGYECMGEFGIAGRRFYWKGETKRTYQIHLFEKDHPETKRHLAFRDYMLSHPDEAQAYSWIKRCLAEQFPRDIVAYENGKDSFIRAIDYRTGTSRQDQQQAKDQILLEPYNPNWQKLATAEINAIKQFIHLPYLAIEHLGSTAVEGLSAKPIMDIFIALESIDEADQWLEPLKALSYVDWPDNPDKTHARFFKGMPPFGIQRTHHVHIMAMGDEFKRRVAFRDMLRQYAHLRKQYEELKQTLAREYPDDRETYTEAKADFIQKTLSS